MPGEEVTFYSGGCAIAGTFTETADPVAAALLITAAAGRTGTPTRASREGGCSGSGRTRPSPVPSPGPGPRYCGMTSAGSAPAAASTCAPASPKPNACSHQSMQVRRLSEALPTYAAPDQDVCGVDM